MFNVFVKMNHQYNKDCNHTHCTATNSNRSVCQTLSEMDWERGIWNAAFNGEYDKVKSIIDKSRNSEESVNALDNSGYAALHYAARSGCVDICKMLLQYGADIDTQTRSGEATPLHKAAAAGKLNTVKLLTELGASIKMQDADGQTVLHKAAERKSVDVIKYLVKICPELVHIKDKKGKLPLVLDEY